MGTKYLRTMGDRMNANIKQNKRACRGLSVSVREIKPYTEAGLCTMAGIATAALTIVLFAVWFFAG